MDGVLFMEVDGEGAASLAVGDGADSRAVGGVGVSFVLAGMSLDGGISFMEGPLWGLVSSVPAQPLAANVVATIDIMTMKRISMPTSL